MCTFNASALLDTWEHAFGAALPQRSLALLAYAYPDTPVVELANITLGARDALLLRARIALFGAGLTCIATCPGCERVLESTLDASRIALEPASITAQTVQFGEVRVMLRAATLADLFDLPNDVETARHVLAERCIVVDGATSTATRALTEQCLAEIGDALEALDPAAAIDLVLDCPDCGSRWHEGLDVAAFLWREVDAWARRALRDVHALARAYAWNERDILALSPSRRHLYLQLCGA